MEIIWPSFRAAPRIRDSVLTNLSAFSSLTNRLEVAGNNNKIKNRNKRKESQSLKQHIEEARRKSKRENLRSCQ